VALRLVVVVEEIGFTSVAWRTHIRRSGGRMRGHMRNSGEKPEMKERLTFFIHSLNSPSLDQPGNCSHLIYGLSVHLEGGHFPHSCNIFPNSEPPILESPLLEDWSSEGSSSLLSFKPLSVLFAKDHRKHCAMCALLSVRICLHTCVLIQNDL